VYQLVIDWIKANGSIGREVLYNILIQFDIAIKVLKLIKICLAEMGSRDWVGKNLCDMLPVGNGLEQGNAPLPLLFIFASEYAIRSVR
jgi:hypothetical protein